MPSKKKEPPPVQVRLPDRILEAVDKIVTDEKEVGHLSNRSHVIRSLLTEVLTERGFL